MSTGIPGQPKLSLAITTFNRTDLLFNSFAKILNDPRIDEVVILDDHSEPEIFSLVSQHCKQFPKIILHRNARNVGMSLNKMDAIKLCKNEWVIIFDSDNILKPCYLDALDNIPGWWMNDDVIYCPSQALPNFDYRSFQGAYINRRSVEIFAKEPLFSALMNTCNYVVHRETYLKNYRLNTKVKATDTVWYALNHLVRDGAFHIVPDMSYEHLVHKTSGFALDMEFNMDMAEKIVEQISQINKTHTSL